MKKELIKTDNYLLVVDDSEIKEGDWFYQINLNKIVKHNLKNGLLLQPQSFDKNIIAHLPLGNSPILEGVPLLPPLDVEDVWSYGLEQKLNELPYEKHLDDGQYNDGQLAGFEFGAEWGYNKAKEKYKFTEEDAKYLFECGRNFQINADITFTVVREHLSQPKMPTYFEFEIERKSVLNLGIEPFNPNTHFYTNEPKTTTNSQGQVVACGKYIY